MNSNMWSLLFHKKMLNLKVRYDNRTNAYIKRLEGIFGNLGEEGTDFTCQGTLY